MQMIDNKEHKGLRHSFCNDGLSIKYIVDQSPACNLCAMRIVARQIDNRGRLKNDIVCSLIQELGEEYKDTIMWTTEQAIEMGVEDKDIVREWLIHELGF